MQVLIYSVLAIPSMRGHHGVNGFVDSMISPCNLAALNRFPSSVFGDLLLLLC
jgi:hypothetical protein